MTIPSRAVASGKEPGGQQAQAEGDARYRSIDDRFAEVAQMVPSFGGFFIGADKRLHVYLTDAAQAKAAEAAIVTVFGRERIPEGGIHVLEGKYGFLELKSWHDRQRFVTLALPGVVRASIRESRNRLEIGVQDALVIGQVEEQLAKLGIPREAVEIVVTKPVELQQTLQDKARPVKGGIQISRSGANCTLGFLAVRQGVAGFVTNSHCTSTQGGVESTVFHQADIVAGGVNRIGVESVDPQYFTGGDCPDGMKCRYSDAAFVRRDSSASQAIPLTEGDFGKIALTTSGLTLSNDNFVIMQEVPLPVEGDYLHKVGRTTGETAGEVCDTCVDIQQTGTNFVMLCQDRVEASSGPGDSGSPVYSIGANPVPGGSPYAYLQGILWGGDGGVFAFSNLANVQRQDELGALKTHQLEGGANSPPEVKITTPLNGTSVPFGGFGGVQFEADVVDYESHDNFIQLRWDSNVDGLMGFGKTIQYNFSSSGPRTVTVTATDDDGGVDTFAINLTVQNNTPPASDIVKPTPGQVLYRNFPYVFEGRAWDYETFQWLPCGSLTWTSSKAGDPFPKTGCTPQVTFTTIGSRTITLTSIDPHGLTDTDTVTVYVVEPPANSPPLVAILNPTNNVNLNPDAWVTLRGKVDDPDNKNPITYQWVIRKSNGAEIVIGSGTANDGQQFTLSWKPSNNIPFNCGGESVRIYLRATDADGSHGSTYVNAGVGYPPC
ncbi:MAG TPA: hypothetical protein VFC61_09385 [Blastocatellia bacterium]|nr:hypothetical protein [Blastocatellia bacterium]